MKDVTESQIRQWVRDEEAKITQEKQSICLHRKSGTILNNGDLQCDDCKKVLDIEEDGNVPSSGAELRHVGRVL